MKKFLLATAMAVFFTPGVIAQDCSTYYLLQNNKTIEMTAYNRKGDPDGKQVYSITDVKNSGGSFTANFQSEMFNKKGKSQVKANGTAKCKDGIMFVDAKVMMPPAQQEQMGPTDAKVENVYIEYPRNMQPGETLKDANLDMEWENKGMKQSVSLIINNRKVEAKESVTTTAGTWDCFKITYKMRITIKIVGIGVPANVEGTEWFAPGFGIVKNETKYGSTAVTAIK